MKKEHILIIRFSAIGDVAMAVPVVYSLATQYPEIRITVLSRGYARSFFEDLAPNVGFMEADIKSEYKGLKGLNALYRRLTAKNFTAVADFHSVLRSEYLRIRFNMGGYKVAHINKHRALRKQITAPVHKKLEQLPTSFQNYADVLNQLGYPVKIQFKSIFGNEYGNLNMLPAIIGPKNNFEHWIGIAPFAAHAGKVYPPRLMEQVIKHITIKYPHARIFLFGKGPSEEKFFNTWCTAMPQCIYVAKHLENMHQELILMSHLDVMISMDSANMHMASLVGTRVVSIWGATHPYAGFLGWNQSIEDVIQIELPCRPCSIFGNKPCIRGDFACMKNIAPETIVDKIECILQSLK